MPASTTSNTAKGEALRLVPLMWVVTVSGAPLFTVGWQFVGVDRVAAAGSG